VIPIGSYQKNFGVTLSLRSVMTPKDSCHVAFAYLHDPPARCASLMVTPALGPTSLSFWPASSRGIVRRRSRAVRTPGNTVANAVLDCRFGPAPGLPTDHPLAARYAGLEQVPLQHRIVVGHVRDNDG
jgi:hypothetical protein